MDRTLVVSNSDSFSSALWIGLRTLVIGAEESLPKGGTIAATDEEEEDEEDEEEEEEAIYSHVGIDSAGIEIVGGGGGKSKLFI